MESTQDRPYRDGEWLRQKYIGEMLSTYDIADICGVSAFTIQDWLDRHGIQKRENRAPESGDTRYRNESWLREKYSEGLRQREIAELCGVAQRQVSYWMEKYGIETYPSRYRRVGKAAFFTNPGGYECWADGTDNVLVKVHRLLAVSEYGRDAVKNMHVHHTTHIPWDNRPEAIELLSPSDHAKEHFPDGPPAEEE